MAATSGYFEIFSDLISAENRRKELEIATNSRFVSSKCKRNNTPSASGAEDRLPFGSQNYDTATTIVFEDHYKVKLGRLQYTGVPFACLGTNSYNCQFGSDAHAKRKADREKKEKESTKGDHLYNMTKRFRPAVTKKLGCPARVVIREIVTFPEFQVSESEAPRNRRQECRICGDILARIRDGHELMHSKKFVLHFPADDMHFPYHPTGNNEAVPENIDPNLSAKIRELVSGGMVDVSSVRDNLRAWVKMSVKPLPHPTNKRYYPTDKTVRNHVYNARTGKVADDQIKIAEWVNELKQSGSFDEDFIYFRLKGEATEDATTSGFEVGDKILFCYQSSWQKRLQDRYGCMVLLDATYRTSLYDLPVFFLAVKTNVGYQITGCFVTEDETIESIKEALELLKPRFGYMPVFFMTDNDSSEISAVEQVFPDSRVLICDFHREQAWERWAKKKENNKGRYRKIMELLRGTAVAQTEEDFTAAVSALRSSAVYTLNLKLQNYFENEWFKKRERWASYFRRSFVMVVTGVTNGVERQHGLFKSQYLKKKSNYGLYTMLQIMVHDFLPSRYIKYIDDNQMESGKFRIANQSIPEILKGRPKAFINTCLKNMGKAGYVKRSDVEANNTRIGNSEEWPHCDCVDWNRDHVPCIHIFAAMREQSWDEWAFMSPLYLSSVFCNIDDDLAGDMKHLEEVMYYRSPLYSGCDTAGTEVEQNVETEVEQNVETEVEQIVETEVEQNVETEVEQNVEMEVEQNVETEVEQNVLTEVEQNVLTEVEQNVQTEVEPLITEEQQITSLRLKCIDNLKLIQSEVYNNDNPQQLTIVEKMTREIVKKINQKNRGKVVKHIKVLPLRTRRGKRRFMRRHGIRADRERQHSRISISTDGRASLNKQKKKNRTNDVDGNVRTNQDSSIVNQMLPSDFDTVLHSQSCKVITDVWNGGEFESREIGPYMINKNSLLDSRTELPDEVIDAFLYSKVSTLDDVMHINCREITGIVNGDDIVTRCLSHQRNLQNFKAIIGAYHELHGHWVLIVILPYQKQILYVNSLSLDNDIADQLKFYISNYWYQFLVKRRDLGIESEVPERYEVISPRSAVQRDTNSCGLYTLKCAERYLLGEDFEFHWSQDDVQTARLTLLAYLYTVSVPESLVATIGPEQHAPNSPQRSANSPQRSANSPQRSANSPQRSANSPQRSANSTPRSAYSPQRSANSPQRSANSPQRSANSPQRSANSTPRSAYSPPRSAYSPPRSANSPQRSANSPQRSANSPPASEPGTRVKGVRNLAAGRRKMLQKKHSVGCSYPSPVKRRKRAKEPAIYCICKKPNDNREYWECEGCTQWFHPECVGHEVEKEPTFFFCPECDATLIPEQEDNDIEESNGDVEVLEDNTEIDLSKRVPGSEVVKKIPKAVAVLMGVVKCMARKCTDPLHSLHHEFFRDSQGLRQREKRLEDFGLEFFNNITIEVVLNKMIKKMSYTIPSPTHPCTGAPLTMINGIKEGTHLYRHFRDNNGYAMQYLVFVLPKTFLTILAVLLSGGSLEEVITHCKRTEKGRT